MSEPTPPVALRRTALHAAEAARHAHFTPFSGWEMPLYYSSILPEHKAVRSAAGVFDVSHMGKIVVSGARAAALLSRRSTADVSKLAPGQCRYAFATDFEGKIVDDLLLTRLDPGPSAAPAYLVVPNAGTAGKIDEMLRQHRKPDTTVTSYADSVSILAVQGPDSRALVERVLGVSLEGLRFYTARGWDGPADRPTSPPTPDLSRAWNHGLVISRTGYTGELGYELFVPSAVAPTLFDRLLDAGALACGLGARDTLRLEKGYLLSGQDFHRDRTPFEAGQEKFVDLDHPFVGREALIRQKSGGVPARLSGLRLDAPGAIPRSGAKVSANGSVIATCTSGGQSPSLGVGIALAYLPAGLGVGASVTVEVRGHPAAAVVVPLPFYPAATHKP